MQRLFPGYRIIPAVAPGMTPQYSSYAKPAPFQKPVPFYRVQSVCRTGGFKAAITTQPGAQGELVSFDDEERYPTKTAINLPPKEI